jgi:Fe-S-cluster containining protein
VKDPKAAVKVRERARQAAAAMAEDFPGHPESGILSKTRKMRSVSSSAMPPCPALEPESGACALCEFRPLSCRTFGLPVRIGSDALPPCRLCFSGATVEELEACRAEIDAEGIESRPPEAMEGAGTPSGQTVVATALLAGVPFGRIHG